MTCPCTATPVQREAVTLTSHLSGDDGKGSPPAAPALPASSARRFYCLCTVCGKSLPDIPTVMCDSCGSQTHITCARDAYSHEWLFMEVVGPSGPLAAAGAAGTLAATINATAPSNASKAAATTSPASASTTRGKAAGRGVSLPSPPTSREEWSSVFPTGVSHGVSHSLALCRDMPYTNLLSSPQALSTAAAKIGKEYNYYCHPDCAMGMEVMRNPQFNAALSARVESAFAVDWRRTLQMLSAHLDSGIATKCWEDVERAPASATLSAEDVLHRSNGDEESQRKTEDFVSFGGTSILSEVGSIGTHTKVSIFKQLLTAARGSTVLAQQLSRLYSQLRAEAWADYFEQERHHSGHPLFYPPPFVDVQREAALSHVLEAASPQGQAARLYLLDPATHPVGSAVAVPIGVLARWQQPALAPLVKVNDSNNFVAEAAAAVANNAVVPETVRVYRNCSKDGQAMLP
ncbi:hypothetical protein ABL78_7323 [Leptomonas seymouri]|uniref:Uncharacterized protein n=1 Tax=Leptomonas seymouri TaxID=5684 RepID=A0A0N1HZQ4_LEPSE|nr:hypothetical protein ABL78_7323 [Leptomonas seymouri]|eukprot:KPI83634.1 hypothetical protein ABL78_7323 [Leptomonas seymouri]